ncbi:MAG TPA: GNAT family protein [Pseudonocardia sp.]|nr:GNAT family protein [Pseudonocardia sp.]
MRGELVSLRAARSKEDFDWIADWSSSVASIYSAGGVYPFTGEQLRSAAEQGGMSYLMVLDRHDEVVGAVNYQQLTYPGHFEVGNAIGVSELWGLGYGAESVALLLEYLFHQKMAHRIHLVAGSYNLRMMQLFVSGKIHVEGVLRDYFFLDGAYHDAVVGSILREEFYALVPAAEKDGLDLVPSAEKREAADVLDAYLRRHGLRPSRSPLGRGAES